MMSFVLLLGVKAYDIFDGGSKLSRMLLAGNAVAEAAPEEAEKASDETKKSEEKKDGEEKSADVKKDSEDKKEGDVKDEKAESSKKEEKKGKDGEKLEKGVSMEAPKHVIEPSKYSQTEIDLLQKLSERRDQLDKWEEQVRLKENLLNATELRIKNHINEIKNLEATVKGLLAEYNKQEDVKIRSLVKIYENMKPRDAAAIFNELEMPVLLMVIDKMAERKSAVIIGMMSPQKAKLLTVELAQTHKLKQATEQALAK